MASHIPPKSAFMSPEFQDSLCSISKGSDQVMIYGWSHCAYYEINYATKGVISSCILDSNLSFPIKKLFRNFIGGDPAANTELATTLEGRKINLIDYNSTSEKKLSRQCKTAIANIVLENYKRQKEGLPLIPVIFAIDITDNPHPYSIEKICSKASRINGQVTHKELRRAYKLCTHPNPKIRAIALQTFKFVKVCVKDKAPTLEKIPAPWDSIESPKKVSSKFAACWETRKKDSTSTPKHENFDWSQQLEKHIARYDRVSRIQAAMTKHALQTKQHLDTLGAKAS